MHYNSAKSISLAIFLILSISGVLSGQSFSGTFETSTIDGKVILELKQDGSRVSGTYAETIAKMALTATVESGKAQGMAVMEGTPVRLFIKMSFQGPQLVCEITEEGDDGKPDPQTTERLSFVRVGNAPDSTIPESAAKPSATNTPDSQSNSSQLLDKNALQNVAGCVKSNFKREKPSSILAQGNPPLTLESVIAFAGILRLTFGIEMTETEFDSTSRHFVQYYQQGDQQTKTMLSGGWQNILSGLEKAQGSEKTNSISDVRNVLEKKFADGAKTGMPWAVAMQATIQRRKTTVATIDGNLPEYAKKSEFHQQMTEADLEASLEMLYFMWVACGRDASLVTPETVANVRGLIVRNFASFPPEVQYVFANAQKVYSSLRGQWAQATPAIRAQMAGSFAISLDQLGLTVPVPGGDAIQAGGAWSDVNGKSHGEWAAAMVQGLAGSSYKSSW